MTVAITATYRVQLTPRFGFDAVVDRFDHLRRLHVSHVYLSPIAQAIPDSAHGYDVVDPTVVRAEFGGADRFEQLLDAAADVGLGVIVDHVPNHMSIARPELNRWWWQTLRDGPSSPTAKWFDIDWEANGQRVILPLLDRPAAAGALLTDAVEVVGDELVVEQRRRLPLRPGTEQRPLDELLAAQHYELVASSEPRRNMRRFFTVDDLAAVRVEDEAIADIVDTLPRRYGSHPAFVGVRLDHIDGLADPTRYLDRLHQQLGGEALMWVEKILAPGERLPDRWPVAGTTGYESIRSIEHVLLDAAAGPAFSAAWRSWSTDPRDAAQIDADARVEVFDGGLAPDADRVWRTARSELPNIDPESLRAELRTLSTTLPRYRTYLPDAGASVLESMQPGPLRDAVLAGRAPATRTRWQQLTGPVMAKGAEDRAFYRYLRLAGLCEVGGEPGWFGHSSAAFHTENRWRAEHWPLALTAASTHDSKRSEDVRTRSLTMTWIADVVLAEAARLVPALSERLQIDPSVVWLGWQTDVTTPGLDSERFVSYLVKASRESEMFTSWHTPDARFEAQLTELVAHLLSASSPTKQALDVLAPLLTVEAVVLRLLGSGVPDIYQGTESWSYLLVDPDNRRPPDWTALVDELGNAIESELTVADLWAQADLAIKPVLVRTLLDLRRRLPAAFARGAGYEPLDVGDGALAFVRRDQTDVRVVVVARRGLAPVNSMIDLPDGRWFDLLDPSSPTLHGTVAVSSLVGSGHDLTMPVAVLERD